MPWITTQQPPGGQGEPQSVRDAWDARLQAQREAEQQPEAEAS